MKQIRKLLVGGVLGVGVVCSASAAWASFTITGVTAKAVSEARSAAQAGGATCGAVVGPSPAGTYSTTCL
jgi:hypothetical protein